MARDHELDFARVDLCFQASSSPPPPGRSPKLDPSPNPGPSPRLTPDQATLLPSDAFGPDAPEGSEVFRFETIASKPSFILSELEATQHPVVFLVRVQQC